MQQLQVFQSLWAMEKRIPGVPEASHAENFQAIADAGYHGVCLDPGVDEIDEMMALEPLFQKHDLKCMVNAFPATVEELDPLLVMAKEMNAVFVNIIGAVMPLTVSEGVDVVTRWLADSRHRDVQVLFETHRDCTLNDLYYALQLIERVPEMRLCADLSHYVIDREMRLPLGERDAGFMQTILERSDCFQGRIANREQVQVQIDFPQHQDWVHQFRSWWEFGIARWRQRNAPDATLYFLCELGPPPYAITDANQRELSDRWLEALRIRGWVEEIWAQTTPARG